MSMIVKLRELQALMDGDPAFRTATALEPRTSKQHGMDEENLLVNVAALRDLLTECKHTRILLEHIAGVINPADGFT
jgi:hypothetical protein